MSDKFNYRDKTNDQLKLIIADKAEWSGQHQSAKNELESRLEKKLKEDRLSRSKSTSPNPLYF